MKKILIGLMVLAGLAGCQSEVNVTQPTILIGTQYPKALDTLEISVTEYADIDGERIVPDYYEWTILDVNDNIAYSGFADSKNVNWILDSAGIFKISVKIGYDGNKSITTLKEITVNESPGSLQQKLVGNWTGTAEAMFGVTWKIDVTFAENGHYIATAYDISDTQYPARPFYCGYKYIVGQGDFAPSPDIPCQAFVIDEVINKKGFGILWVGYEYINGSEYSYECNNNYEIQYLSFTNNGNNVYFSLIDYGTDYNEWFLRYNLERVE